MFQLPVIHLWAICVLLCCVSTTGVSWKHPGVFVGADQLAFVKELVDSKTDPVYSAFTKAVASPYGSHSYVPLGPPVDGIIDCGSYSHPDLGCSEEDSDGAAAYLQLVLFSLTNDTRYSITALKILDGYGSGLKRYNNSNAPLQAAWGSSKWARAAELAAHLPGVNWPAASIAAFANMLRSAALPLIENGSDSNGNWELVRNGWLIALADLHIRHPLPQFSLVLLVRAQSMIEGLIGIAVFTEDSALFERALQFWAQRLPAYFYDSSLDGDKPVPAPRGDPGWYGQVVFNASTSGVAQETCRDEGHTTYAVAAAVNAAETAVLQGASPWSSASAASRYGGGVEFNAALLLPGAVSPKTLCGGTPVDVSSGTKMPSYEVAHARLTSLGFASPNALQHIVDSVRMNPDPVDAHMCVYETLTHGGGLAH
jgi:hypothetical protein